MTATIKAMCYITINPCGCVLYICSDKQMCHESLAEDIPNFIRQGIAVERVTAEEGQRRFGYCDEHRPVKEPDMFE